MARRGRKRNKMVAPHKSLKHNCKSCKKYHTENVHRFHGTNSYETTHKTT
jgi:hypothetical protein